MAEEEVSKDDVILKQMEGVAFGGSTADALNLFLSGLQTFGNNFAVICDTLIQFFQATKLFLESFAQENIIAHFVTCEQYKPRS